MNIDLDKFQSDYLDGLRLSNAEKFDDRKEDALQYVASEYPDAIKCMSAFGKLGGAHKSASTYEELMGSRINGVAGRAVIKYLKDNPDKRPNKKHRSRSASIVKPNESNGHNPNSNGATMRELKNPFENGSMRSRYFLWLQEHNFVCCDEEISYWTGQHISNFSQVRSVMKAGGFDFQKNKNGWTVSARPSIDTGLKRNLSGPSDGDTDLISRIVVEVVKQLKSSGN